jgi:hypothetical protein
VRVMRPQAYHDPMRRVERRLLRIVDEIDRLRGERHLALEELRIHEHLDDDARRDAAVGGPIEREDARVTGSDVERFRSLIDDLDARITRLDRKRAKLLKRLV